MNNNMSEKKVWVTPSIEEAPVQITAAGFTPKPNEGFCFSPTCGPLGGGPQPGGGDEPGGGS